MLWMWHLYHVDEPYCYPKQQTTKLNRNYKQFHFLMQTYQNCQADNAHNLETGRELFQLPAVVFARDTHNSCNYWKVTHSVRLINENCTDVLIPCCKITCYVSFSVLLSLLYSFTRKKQLQSIQFLNCLKHTAPPPASLSCPLKPTSAMLFAVV